MTIDGKKKWTAALIAIAGTMVAQLAPGQEDTIMSTVQSLAPMVVGGIYILSQWRHDMKKEEVKVEENKAKEEGEKTRQIQATAVAAVQTEALEEVQNEIEYEPFDQEAFERKVKARSVAAYFVNNPLTEFQAAADKAVVTPCKNVGKAQSFWFYYVHKVLDAFEHLYKFPYSEAEQNLSFSDKTGKSCTAPDLEFLAIELGEGHHKLLMEVKFAQRTLAQVGELKQYMVDWVHPQTKAPQRWTLWTLGVRAKEMLTHNT